MSATHDHCSDCSGELELVPVSILIGFLRIHPLPGMLAAAYLARDALGLDTYVSLCPPCGWIRPAFRYPETLGLVWRSH